MFVILCVAAYFALGARMAAVFLIIVMLYVLGTFLIESEITNFYITGDTNVIGDLENIGIVRNPVPKKQDSGWLSAHTNSVHKYSVKSGGTAMPPAFTDHVFFYTLITAQCVDKLLAIDAETHETAVPLTAAPLTPVPLNTARIFKYNNNNIAVFPREQNEPATGPLKCVLLSPNIQVDGAVSSPNSVFLDQYKLEVFSGTINYPQEISSTKTRLFVGRLDDPATKIPPKMFTWEKNSIFCLAPFLRDVFIHQGKNFAVLKDFAVLSYEPTLTKTESNGLQVRVFASSENY